MLSAHISQRRCATRTAPSSLWTFTSPTRLWEQYEQRLYEALMVSDSYADAVMNSDAENAALTGERVLREFVADSEDRDFQRTYYDNPRLREALNRMALDAAYHDLSEPPVEDEPELDDTPVNIQPREPMASAFGVGDFVWYEGREYQITDLQRGYVELLPPGMPIPVYRTESQKDFESGIRADERNRYITDYLTTELSGDVRDYVSNVLTQEDRAQISAWLRDGEGNAQLAEKLVERLAGRDGIEADGLHYRIPDDAGNIVATGFVPWEQLAGAVRGMYRDDPEVFEQEPGIAVEQPKNVDEANHKFREHTVAYYDAEANHLPYDVVFQTIGSAPEPEPTPTTPRNFRIMDDQLGEGGAKARFRANMDAITTIKRIEAEGRAATADEQEVLSRYTGWGAIPDAFDESKSDWAKEYAELKAALTPEEYEAVRSSTLNAHYTSPTVIRAIYDALVNLGFEGGRILEPSCGVGNFFGLLPDSMADSQLYGVELDSITGRIAQQLYPDANIEITGFENTEFADGFFDVAIGNVPFGNYQVFDPEYNRLGFSIHNYFAAKMLDQVRPGGIVAFVRSVQQYEQICEVNLLLSYTKSLSINCGNYQY